MTESDAATPEQVDLVVVLLQIRDRVTPLAEQLMGGARPPADWWSGLADILTAAGRLCREQAEPISPV